MSQFSVLCSLFSAVLGIFFSVLSLSSILSVFTPFRHENNNLSNMNKIVVVTPS